MNSIKTYVEGKSLKVFFIISYQGKRFQVYTGITSTVKFSGMVFPKSVPNARAKTAMLARLFASVEEYVYMNTDLPIARMKDEIKAIINGRTASVEKNILYYIDEFIKTKAKDSTKEIFLRTRKRIESFDEHADLPNRKNSKRLIKIYLLSCAQGRLQLPTSRMDHGSMQLSYWATS